MSSIVNNYSRTAFKFIGIVIKFLDINGFVQLCAYLTSTMLCHKRHTICILCHIEYQNFCCSLIKFHDISQIWHTIYVDIIYVKPC